MRRFLAVSFFALAAGAAVPVACGPGGLAWGSQTAEGEISSQRCGSPRSGEARRNLPPE